MIILKGDWYSLSLKYILSEYLSNIQSIDTKKLSVTNLYNSNHWNELQATSKSCFGIIDKNIWSLSDDDFYKYFYEISKLNFDSIYFENSPYFDFLNPDIDGFDQLLKNKTSLIRNLIRNTKIISPPICLINEKYQSRYFNYLISNRNNFDIYGLSYFYDCNEPNIAKLFTCINQLVNISKKPIYVLNWSVYCCEKDIEQNYLQSNFVKNTQTEAYLILLKNYNNLVNNFKTKIEWFLKPSKDDYAPSKSVPNEINTYSTFGFDRTNYWNFNHFLGLVDYNNNIKQKILDAYIEIHAKQQKHF